MNFHRKTNRYWVVLFLLLTACATSPATGRRFFTTISPSEEAGIGAEQHPKILQQFGGAYPDTALQNYVSQLGKRLASQAERKDVTYTFTIVNTPDINAFAVPGGYIYVTRGLMALANNEAELAGVLSHEIGHINARHTAERQGDSILLGTGALIGQLLGAVVGLPALGDIASTGAAATLQSYSRDQEFEADSLGVRYLDRGGYQTRAMADFLDSLLRDTRLEAKEAGQEGAADKTDIFASHPRTMDRVDRAIQEAGPNNPNAKIERDAYLNRIGGLLYGDDPEQGFIRHHAFIHPKLRFAFDLPNGYRAINQPTMVAAVSKDQSNAIIFLLADPQPQGNLDDYLANQVARRIPLRNIQAFSVNQFEAATGIAVGRDANSGRAKAIRIVVLRGADGKTYMFELIGSPSAVQAQEGVLNQVVHSYRSLSPQEAAQYKPQRVALVTVGTGDTQESLAQKMQVEEDKLEWFQVLNRLDPATPLVPGQKLKIIIQQ